MTNYRFIKFCATLILLFSKIIKAENIIENCTNNLNFGSDLSLESNILIEKLNVSADDMYFKKLELSDQNLTELGMQCYTDYNDSLSTQNDITNLSMNKYCFLIDEALW
ncbi:hypothetical protein TKK_0015767 [Trichogramma kaykai]